MPFCAIGKPLAVAAKTSGEYSKDLDLHIRDCRQCEDSMPRTCLGCGCDYPCKADCPAGTGRRLPDAIE